MVSRLDNMSESGTIIENYTYLGYSTVVQRGQGDGVSLTSIAASRTQTADAGDPYIGLDRFGRVVDQKWVKSGTAVDEYT